MLQKLSYIINVAPEGVPQVVKLSQNENGRTLEFTLTGAGVVSIPAGSTVTISGTKPDGVVYSATGTLSGNTVSFSETTQMTAVSGIWPAKIKVTYSGETIATCKVVMAIDPDPVEPGSVPSNSQLNGLVAEAQQYATYAKEEAYGSPLVAATKSAMTNTSRVYVYTGSETGMTAGHWYYYNGSAWTDGGVYNSQGINTDTTLTLSGMAADSKATGDQISGLKSDFINIDNVVIDPQKDLYADALIPIAFEKGKYYGGSGYITHTRSATSQLLPAGVYMFPAIKSGFKYNVYRYISDSSGSAIMSDVTTAQAVECEYNFIVSITNNSSDITQAEINEIAENFIPLAQKSNAALCEDAVNRIVNLELDTFKTAKYPNYFDSGRFDTPGFSKPRNGVLVSRMIYPAGIYSISISNSNYDFSIVYYNSDSSGTTVYSYSSTTRTNIYLNKPFYINLRKGDATNITPSEKKAMVAALTVTRTIPDRIPVTFCDGYSESVLQEFYVPSTSPIYNTAWKFYRVGSETTGYRLGILLADSTIVINGFNVSPEYFADKVHALTYGGNILAYYVLHYTGSDYYRTTTSGAAYESAVNDINNSPRIKEYLSREENLVLIGDSIFGYAEENELEPILGAISDKKVFNCGFGGCSMAWRSQSGTHVLDPLTFSNVVDAITTGDYSTQQAVIGQDNGYPPRVASLKAIDWTKPTTVIVDYGNNDLGLSLPIGDVWEDGETASDWDRATVLGAMTYGIQKLMSVYPHVRIIFCTPIWRYINNTMFWDYTNTIGKTAQDYREAIQNNSKQTGVSCFDLSLKSGRNPWNIDTYQVDTSHWNVAGYTKFARQLNAIDNGELN